ncbi:MAG: efflux transporter outer membrane subunit [Gammaproteobacteria bacterium]
MSACSGLAGPDYERPQTPAKTDWSRSPAVQVSTAETISPDWWTAFGDAELNRLIDKAIAGNFDIKILANRIEVARAGIGLERAGLLPRVNAALGIEYDKTTGLDSSTTYSAAGFANWEIDIWGKVQKAVSAQEAQYEASEADWRAGYLTLVSEVAGKYTLIRQFDEQMYQQRASLEKNEQILQIFDAMYREGLVPETRVLQQQAEVGRLKTELSEFQRLRDVAQNQLATLVGVPAGTLDVAVAPLTGSIDLVEVPAQLPSDLLSRRPDIISAEYRVLQAHELVGVARLARLPTIGISARGGTAAAALSNVFKAWTFGLAPTIDIPILDPSTTARLEVSEAQKKVTEEEYRSTVMRAFEEVENAMVNLLRRKEQRRELELQLAQLRVVSDQVRAQLEEGLVSQLDVFEAERSLLSAEQALLENYQLIVTDTVALYKALGGGWPREAVGYTAVASN